MATATQTFQALIKADAKGAVQDLRKFNGEIEKVTVDGAKRTEKLGAAFTRVGGIVAGLGVAKVMTDAIGAASDLEESVNAVNVVFGEAADGVLRLSEDAARGVGLAKTEFNELAVSFAAFAEDVAGEGGNVAGVIDDLTTRSADFASVMNIDVADAARVFSSTLAGESEPIKRFGIIIDDAAVKAKALELGLADTAAEVSSQDKVLARYELLMEKTGNTAGDFANTSDSLANRQRILKAELTNLSAELGESLVPAAEAAATAVGGLIDVANTFKVPQAFEIFGEALKGIVGDAEAGKDGLAGIVDGLETSTAGQRLAELNTAVDDLLSQDNALERFATGWQMAWGLDSSTVRRNALGDALDEIGRSNPEALRTVSEDLFGIVQAAESGNVAAQQFADKFGLSMDVLNEGITTVQSSAEAFDVTDMQNALSQSAASAEDHGVASVMASEAMRDEARAANDAADRLLVLEERQRDAAEATERHRQAVSDLFDEVNKNISTMFDYEDATIDLQNGSEDLAQNTWDLIEAYREGEITTAEYERGLRDLRTEENQLARDALGTATAYATSQGAIEGTTAFAMLQREELERLREKFPELNDEIGLFIAELDKIPAVKTVSLIIERDRVNSQLAAAGASNVRIDEFGNARIVGVGATGGIVTRPTLSLIGEAGPEAVVPLNRMPGASPLPGGGGGGNVYHINVSAPAGANADEFGRAVREAIRRETRWSGNVTGWSAA